MRHCGEERWAARRFGRHFGRGMGFGGRHGMGGGDIVRAGRMLAQGDLRLIALALIAEQPRHGYEIIKVLEEKTSGWYSPSPGVVYPTLTYLEEAGYLTGQADGAKKLYTITDEGRGYLADNKDFVDAVLERFEALGKRLARSRGRGEDDDRHGSLPNSVRGAMEDLSDATRAALRDERLPKSRVIEIIERATEELKKT